MINSANLYGFRAPTYNPEATTHVESRLPELPPGRPSLLQVTTPTQSSEINPESVSNMGLSRRGSYYSNSH